MNTNTISRQVRRANERRASKALKGNNPTLLYIGAFYKDNCINEGFSIGATVDKHPQTVDVILHFYKEARKTYDTEVQACKDGIHPDYMNVTMDQVVSDTMKNMKSAIHNYNMIMYGSPKRKMGEQTMEFSWNEVSKDLFYIILGIVYGELHGVLESDNYNGMSLGYMG
tara:strand:- start:1449 stop:1955 length:507 start_codon:yes stop_codon:yes gene_type:complete